MTLTRVLLRIIPLPSLLVPLFHAHTHPCSRTNRRFLSKHLILQLIPTTLAPTLLLNNRGKGGGLLRKSQSSKHALLPRSIGMLSLRRRGARRMNIPPASPSRTIPLAFLRSRHQRFLVDTISTVGGGTRASGGAGDSGRFDIACSTTARGEACAA